MFHGLQNSVRKVLMNKVSLRSLASFKSDLSLDKIYPNTTEIKPFTPPKKEDGLFSGYIPIEDLKISYCKSGGPGGQHANKKNTKVDMRFHVQSAKWLSEATKQKLFEKCVTRINKDGYLVIKSEKTRFTLLNTLDAITKLREIIYKMEAPIPEMSEETEEKLRKRKEKAIRLRLMEKRKISMKKKLRSGEFHD